MSAAPVTDSVLLPLSGQQCVDEVCCRFELAWKTAAASGSRPDPAAYLAAAPELIRATLVRELIHVDVYHRRRAGDCPETSDYLERFPTLDPAWLAAVVTAPADAAFSAEATPTGPGAGPSPESAPLGLSVAGYDILGVLGRGGMGVVYRARHVALDRVVALKMILAGDHAGPEELSRFRREAEAVAQLQHPHIVQIHDVGVQDGRPYFALEYVAGGSLDKLLAGAPQPAEAAAQLVETVARAVHYAHQRGIIHRDLKPANILLAVASCQLSVVSEDRNASLSSLTTDNWQLTTTPKITDFGLAKRLDTPGGATQSGAVLGTPSYMAPEQAAGHTQAVGPATDTYALGAVLYEVLTGRPPFKGATLLDTLEQVKSHEPVPPRRLQPKVPRDLETICLKCLRREPAQRYASAEALANDLRNWLHGEPIQARPVGRFERSWRWCRRNPAVASLLTLVVLLLLGVTTVSTVAAFQNAAARRQEAELRRLADANFARARDAVEKFLIRVTEHPKLKAADFHELRKELLNSALPFYEEFVRQKQDDPDLEADRASAYVRLGLVRYALGETDKAIAHYRDAQAIWALLAEGQRHRPEFRLRLAGSHNDLAVLLHRENQLREAADAFRQALKVYQELVHEYPDEPLYRQKLAGSCNGLGELLRMTGPPAEAAAAYLQAAGALEPLTARSAVPQIRQELARLHNNRAILLYTSARPNDAASAFRQVQAVFQGLVRDFPEEPQYRKELAGVCNNLGYLLAETNQLNEAEQEHLTALEIRKKLVHEFQSVPEYHYDLAISHKNLGKVLDLLHRMKEAESASREAVGILANLTEKFPRQSQIRHSLAQGQNLLGELLWKTGRPKEAETAFRDALKHLQELVKQPPLVPDQQSDLGNTLANLALVARERHEPAEARRLLEQALHYQHAAITSNRTHPEYRRSLRNHYQDMTELLVRQGEHAAAVAAATGLAGHAFEVGEDSCRAASFLARCMPLATKDNQLTPEKRQELAQRYSDRAVALLRGAIQKGFKDVERLQKDKGLDPLRSREDFRKLLSELEEWTKPGPP